MKRYKRTLLDEIKYYGFYIWWNWLSLRPLKIKSFFERGWRGWANEDTWDFDLYLAEVISKGLKQLKKYNHGCPGEICNKYKDRKDLTQKEKDDLAVKEWNTILDIIIRGFELVPELFDNKYLTNMKLRKATEYEIDRAFDFFKKYYFNLWD